MVVHLTSFGSVAMFYEIKRSCVCESDSLCIEKLNLVCIENENVGDIYSLKKIFFFNKNMSVALLCLIGRLYVLKKKKLMWQEN